MSANGRLKASELVTVQTGVQLAKNTAARFKLLKAAAKKQLGRTIIVAKPAGGYRSYSVQEQMHNAGAYGPASARVRWGLNPNSKVSIASAGLSSHGTGTRVDIVGSVMDTRFLALANHYGFQREFGSADPNHFIDRGTYKLSVVKKATAAVKAAVSSKKVYVVIKSGDTLSELADRYSLAKNELTVGEIIALNPGIQPTNLAIGQKVRIA